MHGVVTQNRVYPLTFVLQTRLFKLPFWQACQTPISSVEDALDGHFINPRAVTFRGAPVGSGWVEELVETLRAGAKPCSTQSLLTACLAERRSADQGLPGVGPAVGMGAMSVVVVQIRGQARDEFVGRCEIAAFEEAPCQGAEPQFDLVEPRTVLGCEVEHVLVLGIGQKHAPLLTGTEIFFVEGQAVQSSHEFANIQAPMGVQVVEDPMEALVIGELQRDMGQMGREIHAGAGHAQIPHDLTRGHGERGDQAARAVTDVFVFAFFGFAWLHWNRGVFALEDLHAGLFVAADDQLAVLIQDGGLDIQLADVLSLGVEIGIVAGEPVDAVMRLEVGLVQDAPDGGAIHGFVGMPVDQDGREIIEAPLTGDTVMFAGFAGGQCEDFELFVGGKSSVADRNVEHLEDQRDRAEQSVCAKE
jgi:hypothetical protein